MLLDTMTFNYDTSTSIGFISVETPGLKINSHGGDIEISNSYPGGLPDYGVIKIGANGNVTIFGSGQVKIEGADDDTNVSIGNGELSVDRDFYASGAIDVGDAATTRANLGAVSTSGDTITGTLILSKTTDASGTSDNGPALVVGGTRTTQHIEIDGNEIVAKSDGTHGSRLSLNFDGGGDVYIGPGGLTIGKPLDIGSGGTGQNGVSSATAITFGTTDSRVTSKSGSFCKWGKLVMVNVVVTFTGATTPFNVGNNLDIVLSNVPTPLYDVTSVTYSGGYFFPARLQTDKTMRYRNSMGNGNISGQVSGTEVTFVYLTSD